VLSTDHALIPIEGEKSTQEGGLNCVSRFLLTLTSDQKFKIRTDVQILINSFGSGYITEVK